MERLVLSKNGIYKKAVGITVLFVLVPLCLVIKNIVLGSDEPLDVRVCLAAFFAWLVWALLALRMILYAYPSYIEKLSNGEYEVRTVLRKYVVFQDELRFGRSSCRKYFVNSSFHFDYVVVPYTLLMGRVRFVFERDVSAIEEGGLITLHKPTSFLDSGKCAYVIGRQYRYEGDGTPQDFFRDNRPPKPSKKNGESAPKYVPPELDNRYGIPLPEE